MAARSIVLLALYVCYAAALPPLRPSATQHALMQRQLTQFMHFSLCTFSGCQWDQQPLDSPRMFNPSALNASQWVEVAKLWGAQEICLTVKHVDGFTLWPSKATPYTVAASPYKGGQGDVVQEFVDACRAGGIEPCFYFIPGFSIYNFNMSDSDYLATHITMLTELLTNYGPISRLWFDNYALDGSVYQPPGHMRSFDCASNILGPSCPSWLAINELVRELSPTTAIAPGPDGCLVNPEQEGGTYPLFHTQSQPSGYWCALDAQARDYFVVPESDFTVLWPGDNWFWAAADPVISLPDLWSQYTLKAAQGADLILNIPPDTTGQIPAPIVGLMRNFSRVYHATYDSPVGYLSPPVRAPCSALSVTIALDPARAFDQVEYREDLSLGQVILGYTLELHHAGGAWELVAGTHGKTVGRRLVDWGLGTRTGYDAARFNCTAASDDRTPAALLHFAAYLGAPLS